MKTAAVLLLALMTLAGCAHNAPIRTARAGVERMAVLCKHCNCTMPADVDPDSDCGVCNCGYKAAKCVRGK